MHIGFIGAGRMGAPMVRRLVDAGHDVRVLGRTDEARAAITELGAVAVANVAEAAADAEVVVVCVFTDDQVKRVCFEDGLLAAMPSGTAVVLHTTGSPRTAEAIAAHAPHVQVVDSPVSGGPHDIAAGQVTLFVGGSEDGLRRVRPVLESYGDPIFHVGPTGTGQKVKLINNAMFAAQLGLVHEAVALGGRLGVAESTLLETLPSGSGSSRVVGFIAARGSVGAFIEGVREFVGKDVAVVRKTAEELGSDLGLLDDVMDAGIRP